LQTNQKEAPKRAEDSRRGPLWLPSVTVGVSVGKFYCPNRIAKQLFLCSSDAFFAPWQGQGPGIAEAAHRLRFGRFGALGMIGP